MATRHTQKYTPADMARVGRMVEEGLCLVAIHERAGISKRTLGRWADAHGWRWGTLGQKPKLWQLTTEQKAQAWQYMADGYTRREAANAMGIKYATLCSLALRERWGWPSSNNSQSWSSADSGCDTCEDPRRDECTQHYCVCEKAIEVLDWPEDALWSQNGGRQAMAEAY